MPIPNYLIVIQRFGPKQGLRKSGMLNYVLEISNTRYIAMKYYHMSYKNIMQLIDNYDESEVKFSKLYSLSNNWLQLFSSKTIVLERCHKIDKYSIGVVCNFKIVTKYVILALGKHFYKLKCINFNCKSIHFKYVILMIKGEIWGYFHSQVT